MAEISKEKIETALKALRKRHPLLKVGGVVSLGSYFHVTKPETYNNIKGTKAPVVAKELDNGRLCLYIRLPLFDSEYEELRVFEHSDLEEGDEVWISSIVVLFIENNKGETVVRYDGSYLDEKPTWEQDDLKASVFNKCLDLMIDSLGKGPTVNVSYNHGEKHKISYGTFGSGNDIYLKIHDSSSLRVIKLGKYTNARPLSHGLILAEVSLGLYDVLNSDGTMFCEKVNRVFYGEEYLNCMARLWLFNIENNQWEEKFFGEYHIVSGSIGEGMLGVYKIVNLHNGRRIYKKDAKKYFFVDLSGEIKLEIENEWEIKTGFHNGSASIYNNDEYHNDANWRKIDVSGNIIEEISWHKSTYSHEDNNERENWYAMTDGMYGDYPDEGYDGDYESLGY